MKAMENCNMELTATEQTLAGVKMQRGIFLGDALLFIIAMMSFIYIFRKCTEDYKFIKSQEKINHIMYMDNIKIFAKNEKELETSIQTIRIYSKDVGMEVGIEKVPW